MAKLVKINRLKIKQRKMGAHRLKKARPSSATGGGASSKKASRADTAPRWTTSDHVQTQHVAGQTVRSCFYADRVFRLDTMAEKPDTGPN